MAFMRPLVLRMYNHVGLETRGYSEPLRTELTGIGTFPCVGTHVDFMVACIMKTLLTNRTLNILHTKMNFHVLDTVTRPFKGLLAYVAYVGSFISMYTHMDAEYAASPKPFRTIAACMRPFTSMYEEMLPQRSGISIPVTTRTTVIRPLTTVTPHVINQMCPAAKSTLT